MTLLKRSANTGKCYLNYPSLFPSSLCEFGQKRHKIVGFFKIIISMAGHACFSELFHAVLERPKCVRCTAYIHAMLDNVYTVKKVRGIPVPRRDVTYQTPPGQE
jgi:hypothetical protein